MKKRCFVFFGVLMTLLALSIVSMIRAGTNSEYVMAAGQQSIYKLTLARNRGMIYDRLLRPLVNMGTNLTAAVAPTIENCATLNENVGEPAREQLAVALEDGKPLVMELPFVVEAAGINVFRVPQRYSEDQLAVQVIGGTDSEGRGVSGIERAMDSVLFEEGGAITLYYSVDALGRVISGEEPKIVNTLQDKKSGVVLTLDRDIQQAAQQAAQRLETGAVVVLDAKTNEITAMVSVPGYDPNHLTEASENADSPFLNRALLSYAPGSVFKLVTASALLSESSAEYSFDCTGSVNVQGLEFLCIDGTPHGSVGLQKALNVSCNCYFINAARSLEPQLLTAAAANFGLGSSHELAMETASEGESIPDSKKLQNVRALANFAIGQGDVLISPLSAAGMVNAIANGGEYKQPRLVTGTADDSLNINEITSALYESSIQALEPSDARTLMRYMESTVTSGTARGIQSKLYTAGAKTGTAQTGRFEDEDELLNFWCCGYIREPEGEPLYTIAVLREGQTKDGVTAGVFREIGEYIMENKN